VAAKKTEPSTASQILSLDTSCLIALACSWHAHHAATTRAVEQRLGAGAQLAIAAPALVEAYSVLTRLPAPYRLAPRDALQLLSENFQKEADTVALSAQEHWSLLAAAPGAGIQGGRTYDALIAACARKGRARELLTLNLRHFEPFADSSLRISSPI